MRLTVTTFLSLDGVMQSPGAPEEDPTTGSTRAVWQVPYVDEDMGRLVTDWFAAADAFLLGRKTYEIFVAWWPQAPLRRGGDPDGSEAGRYQAHQQWRCGPRLPARGQPVYGAVTLERDGDVVQDSLSKQSRL